MVAHFRPPRPIFHESNGTLVLFYFIRKMFFLWESFFPLFVYIKKKIKLAAADDDGHVEQREDWYLLIAVKGIPSVSFVDDSMTQE